MSFRFDDYGNPEATLTGFATFGSYETWYRVTGDLTSGRTPLVVLHGGPGASHDYTVPLAALALGGRPVVHYDQVGSGASTPLASDLIATLSPSFFVDELASLLRHLGISDRHLILGHSWGGMVALEYAATRPRGLTAMVLSSSLASAARWCAEGDRLAFQLADEHARTYLYLKNGTSVSPRAYEELVLAFDEAYVINEEPNWPDLGFVFPNELYYTMWGSSEFAFDGTLRGWTMLDRLRRVTTPTLVLWGELDESSAVVNAELIAGLPDVESFEFEGARHVTWASHLEPYLERVAEFLDGHEPA